MRATDDPDPLLSDPLDESTELTPIELHDARDPSAARGHLHVTIIGRTSSASVTLPGSGTFVIGRARDCAIRIDDPSISRQHAVVYVDRALGIEDLGSVNGTRLRGQSLTHGLRTAFSLGESVSVGNATIVVQRSRAAHGPRQVLSHADFLRRLEEECGASERTKAPLAILSIETSGIAAASAAELLSDMLRPTDVLSTHGPTRHLLLLPGTGRPQAELIKTRLSGKLREAGLHARVQRAHFPDDGRTAQMLVVHVALESREVDHDVLVRDPVMVELYELARRLAPSTISILVLGETGAGKDVYAEQLHRASPRADKPFLQLNCAGLSDAMLDSELFGHEKGAFTGAIGAKAGLLETADGGTVFLDEIGDMPANTQAKLLRVLEDGKVRRVGGLTTRPVDVRFVAATNRDLKAAIEAGQFRRDLYFRLNGVTVVLPPLRDRPLEIEPLARMFSARTAAQAGKPPPLIPDDVLASLQSYDWPGNVRQLKNVIARAVLLSRGDAIDRATLPIELTTPPDGARLKARGTDAPAPSKSDSRSDLVTRRPQRGPEEAAWIRNGLDVANGNQTLAAKLLGISRRTLINRLGEYGFERPRRDERASRGEPEDPDDAGA